MGVGTLERLRVVCALAATLGAVGACGAFLSASDEGEPPRVDASTDASETDGATTAEGGDEGMTPCTAKAPAFAEDFASGSISRWEYTTLGCDDSSFRFVSHGAGDDAVALACNTKAVEGYAVLRTPGTFSLGRETTIALTFRIGVADSHVFAQLLDLFGATSNFALVAEPTEIRLFKVNGGAQLTEWTTVDQTQWHTMVIAIEPKDLGGGDFTVKAKLDGDLRTFDITREPNADKAFALQIGAYANVAGGTFDNAFDDIRLWSCP